MKITCLHGYFIFRESAVGDVARFAEFYKQTLVAVDDFYTFEGIAEAPDYSIAGVPYLGIPAVETFEGKPWEVFEANGFAFNHFLGTLVPIAAVTTDVQMELLRTHYRSSGLILPGSASRDTWQKITGYNCFWDISALKFNYTELFYE